MTERMETFMVDSEIQRDALYAGIWNRLCCELRGPEENRQLSVCIEHHATGRGEAGPLLDDLDSDIAFLTEARKGLRALQATPIGRAVELHDVARFMPVAWREAGPSGPGAWIYTDRETEEAELLAPETITRVRSVLGGDA